MQANDEWVKVIRKSVPHSKTLFSHIEHEKVGNCVGF